MSISRISVAVALVVGQMNASSTQGSVWSSHACSFTDRACGAEPDRGSPSPGFLRSGREGGTGNREGHRDKTLHSLQRTRDQKPGPASACNRCRRYVGK